MRMLFVQSLRRALPALLTACALSACGPSESQNGSAVFTNTLTVSPASLAVQVPADPNTPPSTTPCTSNVPQSQIVTPVQIVVRDDRGTPLGNVDISVFLDFAPGTTSGLPTTFLVDGGAQVGVPYGTQTDDDGSKTVGVGFLIAPGCEYAGSLTVTSGVLSAQTAFSVTAQ
jgi:hypothetical protein